MKHLTGVTPARGLAFIQRVETEECYRGGNIVIPDTIRDKVAALQFTVVAVGNYERCEDEDCLRRHTKKGEHKHRLQLGDWIVARNRSWMASPDPDIYVVSINNILGIFEEAPCPPSSSVSPEA